MSTTTYLDLPIEGLYKLLIISVKDMVEASESARPDAIIAFRAAKKQVQLLMDTIEERRARDEEEKRIKSNGH